MRSSSSALLLTVILASTLRAQQASAETPTCAKPAVSRFWGRLDAFCTQAKALKIQQETAQETVPEGERTAVIAVPPYCEPKAIPDFASGSLSAREAELGAAATAAGLGDAALGELKQAAALESAVWLDALAARVAPESAFRTGAGGDLLVSELVSHVCKSTAKGWLEATCAPFGPGPALPELRKRLLLDVAKLPARAAAQNQALDAEQRLRASVALALLDAATSSGGPYELAAELARLAAPQQVERWCSADDSAPPKNETLSTAAFVLLRVLADGPALDRPDAYYEAVIAKALGAVRGQDVQLSRATRTAVRELLAALRVLKKQAAGATPPGPAELVARLDQLSIVTASIIAIVRDQPFAVPLSSRNLARAVLEARLDAALDQAFAAAQELGHTAVDARQREALDAAVRFALAEDEEHAERILRSLILPLGRWSERVLFDINADIPSLESGDFKVVGDLLLGYNGKSWGIAGQGALAEYDFSTGNIIAETTSIGGSLESWYAGNVSRSVKLEGRLVGKTSLYDTSKTATASSFGDETSIMGGGSLLGSVRYQPGERFAGGLWLGAGAQYEWYDTSQFANQTANLDTTESLGLLVNARLRLELAIVPRWLVTRLRVDALRVDIHRESLNTLAGSGMVTTTAEVEQATQVEVHTRLFLDAEVARLAGFVPSLNGGFDSISFDAPGDSHSAFVPVFGAGIRRDAF